MLPLGFLKVLFLVLFFSASVLPLLLLLPPLSVSLGSNLLMTHNFIFLFPYPTSPVKCIALKSVSLPCTPGAAMSLNPDKSDSILFRTQQRCHSFSDVTTVIVTGSFVLMAAHVKLLGVTLDNRLLMHKHVNEVSHTCFYHLHALRHNRPAITASYAVGSRPDYASECRVVWRLMKEH